MKLKTFEQFSQKDPCECGGNCNCGKKSVNEKFSFSKKEVEAAANLIASAISKTDKVKAEVHDLEYDKGRGAGFEISIDGEKYDGGSYVVKDNGDVVNAAIGNSHPNAVYNTIGNKDIADVFTNMKKYESNTANEATVVMDAIDPESKTLKKLLKKYNVKMKVLTMNGPGGNHPEIEMTGSREDLQAILGDPNGWDDPELGEYIEESNDTFAVKVKAVNEAKFKIGEYIKAKTDSDDFDGDVYDITNDADGSPISKNASFEIYKIGKDEIVIWSDEDEVEYSIDPDDLKYFVKESIVTESDEPKCTNRKGHLYKQVDKDGTVECVHCGLRNSLSESLVTEDSLSGIEFGNDDDIHPTKFKPLVQSLKKNKVKMEVEKEEGSHGYPEVKLTGKRKDIEKVLADVWGPDSVSDYEDYFESVVTEAEVTSDEEFKEYAFTVLQKAFGDEFEEAKAQEVVDGLITKHSGDYGAMVGALTSSLGQ